MAHIRQSGPDSGLGFLAKALRTDRDATSSLESVLLSRSQGNVDHVGCHLTVSGSQPFQISGSGRSRYWLTELQCFRKTFNWTDSRRHQWRLGRQASLCSGVPQFSNSFSGVPLFRGSSLTNFTSSPRTLQKTCAWGLIGVLGRWCFLMSEVPLFRPILK